MKLWIVSNWTDVCISGSVKNKYFLKEVNARKYIKTKIEKYPSENIDTSVKDEWHIWVNDFERKVISIYFVKTED